MIMPYTSDGMSSHVYIAFNLGTLTGYAWINYID